MGRLIFVIEEKVLMGVTTIYFVRLAASFEKTAQSDCHWCLNEMKVGAKRKKQDEQADIRLFFRR